MAPRADLFIEYDVFTTILAEVARVDGEQYEDVRTIYGDMSRLVVGWLAMAKQEDLEDIYAKAGWKNVNSRAIKKAAEHWWWSKKGKEPPSAA